MCLKKILCVVLCASVSVAFAQDDTEESKSNKRPSWSSGLPERQSTTDLNKPDFKPDMDDEIEIDMSEFGIKPKAEIEMNLPIDEQLPDTPVAEAEPAVTEEPVVEEVVEVEEQPVAVETPEEELVQQEQSMDDSAEQVVTTEEPAVEEAVEVEEPAVADEMQTEELVAEEQAVEQPAEQGEDATEQANNDQNAVAEQSASDDVESQQQVAEYNWVIIEQKPVDYPPRAAIENLEGWVDIEVTINPAGEVTSASPVDYSLKGRVFGKPAVQSINGWLFEPPSNSGINTPQTRIYRVEFNL